MKKRAIPLLLSLCVLIIVWLLWQARPVQSKSRIKSSAAQIGSERATQAPSQEASGTQARPDIPSAPALPVGVAAADRSSDKRYLETIAPVFQRALVFYGKVVDERNSSVAGARVRYSLMDNPSPNGVGTRGVTESDQDGRFIIKGRGTGIYVEVSKEGYHQVPQTGKRRSASGAFRNHSSLSDSEIPLPTEDEPAVFALHKAGEAASLVHIGPLNIIVPKNGVPTDIDLTTGRIVVDGGGQLRFEVWTNNQDMNPNKGARYDWRCKLTVSNGGLVERTESLQFEAPENGYTQTVELTQSRHSEQWRDNLSKQFFVRLAGNRYARINVQVITNGDHFIVLESFLNPTQGDRNLEFNAMRVIKSLQ